MIARGFPGVPGQPGPKGEMGDRGYRGEKGVKGDTALPGRLKIWPILREKSRPDQLISFTISIFQYHFVIHIYMRIFLSLSYSL